MLKLTCKNHSVLVRNIKVNPKCLVQSLVNDGERNLYSLEFRQPLLQLYGLKIEFSETSGAIQCNRPPKGWYCTRDYGHDGPCAAHPDLVPPKKEPLFGGIFQDELP